MPESFNYIPKVENKQERLDTNNTNLSFTDVESNIKKTMKQTQQFLELRL